MYRFSAKSESSRISAGREPDPQRPRNSAGFDLDPWRSNEGSLGMRTDGIVDHSALGTPRGVHASAPTPPPPSPTRISWAGSSDAVAQGLRFLGMSGREARLYLAFRDAARGAREAAEVAGLHRATCYRILLRLFDRGLIVSDGGRPRRYHAVDLATLFRRLEQFYRDETEIPGCFVEAFGSRRENLPNGHFAVPHIEEHPRVLAPQGRGLHPAILELSGAKRAVAMVVRPLSAPIGYRRALARTLGQLARNGVHIRLITDALPSDYRFCSAVFRESGSARSAVQVRHFSPVMSQFYSIDRRTIVRIPTLGVSTRAAPVAVAIHDRARVQALVTRFESLWSEATGTSRVVESRVVSTPSMTRASTG